MRPTLLFDLDGTLVDSAADLTAALNRVTGARALAPFSVAETKAMVGDGVRRLVERAFAARGRPMDEGAVEAFGAD
ncbi:MAG: HAD hydrolase-like protein, partial [Acetobacteraceae bacterium]